MRLIAIGLVLSIALAGCAERETVTTSATASTTGSIVVPDADGQLPADLVVGCPSGPWFPASALDGGAPLLPDSAVPEVLDAIAPFLEGGEGQFWPQEDWRLLHSDDTTAIAVHLGNAEQPQLSFMNAELQGGVWQWAGVSIPGECPVTIRTAEGLNTVEWELDPNETHDAASTELVLLATERECVSGQAMGDRLLEPQVWTPSRPTGPRVRAPALLRPWPSYR